MNLRGLAAAAVAVVNPPRVGSVLTSTGWAYAPEGDGRRVPTYQRTDGVPMDVQELSERDLAQVQGLSVSESGRTVYLGGAVDSLVRGDGKGGDLLVFDGRTWLVVAVLERFGAPGDPTSWTKVAVVLQDDGTST